jgi:hypothetical protein
MLAGAGEHEITRPSPQLWTMISGLNYSVHKRPRWVLLGDTNAA